MGLMASLTVSLVNERKRGISMEQDVHQHFVDDLDDSMLVAFPVQPHAVQEHLLQHSHHCRFIRLFFLLFKGIFSRSEQYFSGLNN
jgi:hypothetical protein